LVDIFSAPSCVRRAFTPHSRSPSHPLDRALPNRRSLGRPARTLYASPPPPRPTALTAHAVCSPFSNPRRRPPPPGALLHPWTPPPVLPPLPPSPAPPLIQGPRQRRLGQSNSFGSDRGGGASNTSKGGGCGTPAPASNPLPEFESSTL
jgi:hypothetical protein